MCFIVTFCTYWYPLHIQRPSKWFRAVLQWFNVSFWLQKLFTCLFRFLLISKRFFNKLSIIIYAQFSIMNFKKTICFRLINVCILSMSYFDRRKYHLWYAWKIIHRMLAFQSFLICQVFLVEWISMWILQSCQNC